MLHRCSVENELYFSEPFTKRHARQDLVLNANHKDTTIFIRWNEVKINRGQIWWSEITMSKRWTWSRNKVRRFLDWLKTRQQIEQQSSKVTTVITILNYNKYQGNETTDGTTERQQKDSRRNTNNNVKKDKNEKEWKEEEIDLELQLYLQDKKTVLAELLKTFIFLWWKPKKTDTLKSLEKRFLAQVKDKWYTTKDEWKLHKIVREFKKYRNNEKLNWKKISWKCWKSTFSKNGYFRGARSL